LLFCARLFFTKLSRKGAKTTSEHFYRATATPLG
jgi:hypothetical protein